MSKNKSEIQNLSGPLRELIDVTYFNVIVRDICNNIPGNVRLGDSVGTSMK